MNDNVLAMVNGKEITQRDLDEAIVKFPRERQSYFMKEEGKKQLLDQIISFELIYNYAKDSNLEREEDYIAMVERAKKEILTQIGINKILSDVKITDEEIRAYYEVNSHIFKSEESVTAKHILVDTLDEANDIKKKLEEGMNFEMAAMKYSSCPSKAQGGNLGTFTRGKMVPEFEEAAFNLAVNEISDPIKTQFGYHLIKVEEKIGETPKSLDEVYPVIKRELLNERQSYKYMEFTEELKKKYNVEIK